MPTEGAARKMETREKPDVFFRLLYAVIMPQGGIERGASRSNGQFYLQACFEVSYNESINLLPSCHPRMRPLRRFLVVVLSPTQRPLLAHSERPCCLSIISRAVCIVFERQLHELCPIPLPPAVANPTLLAYKACLILKAER